MHGITGNSFLIQRSVVVLRVTLLKNGLVSIDPHNCSEENMRLWRIIAQTQTTYAQSCLDSNKNASPHSLLLSTFDKQGWNIKEENANRNLE